MDLQRTFDQQKRRINQCEERAKRTAFVGALSFATAISALVIAILAASISIGTSNTLESIKTEYNDIGVMMERGHEDAQFIREFTDHFLEGTPEGKMRELSRE